MFYFMSVHSEVILDKIHGTPLREGSSGGDFCYNLFCLFFERAIIIAGYYNTLTHIRHAVLTAVHDDVISRSRKGTFLQGSPALALAAPLLLHCKTCTVRLRRRIIQHQQVSAVLHTDTDATLQLSSARQSTHVCITHTTADTEEGSSPVAAADTW